MTVLLIAIAALSIAVVLSAALLTVEALRHPDRLTPWLTGFFCAFVTSAAMLLTLTTLTAVQDLHCCHANNGVMIHGTCVDRKVLR